MFWLAGLALAQELGPDDRVHVVASDGAVEVWVVVHEHGEGAVVTVPEPLVEPVEVEAFEATVLRTEPGAAVIDAGRDADLQPGTRLRFVGSEEVLAPSLDGEGTERRQVETVVGTGMVTVLEEDRALVRLGRGARTVAGDRVELIGETRDSRWAPERLDGGEVGLAVRPLLALDNLGVAFVNEAWVRWSFEQPWYLQVRGSPIGVGISREGNPLSVAGLATGGYDHRFFSVGLGAGWSRLNTDPGYGSWAVSKDEGGGSTTFADVEGALAIVQEARLGTLDGLHLSVRNTFLLAPEYDWVQQDAEDCEREYYSYYEYYGWCETYEPTGDNSFAFGGIAMRIVAPTGDRTDLVVDWGTGDAGATWVQGGVGSWLRGHGDAGSVNVEVAAGYGSLHGRIDEEYVSLNGPLVSAGGRLRF